MQEELFYHQNSLVKDRLQRLARKWNMASGSHVLEQKKFGRVHGLAVEDPYLCAVFVPFFAECCSFQHAVEATFG